MCLSIRDTEELNGSVEGSNAWPRGKKLTYKQSTVSIVQQLTGSQHRQPKLKGQRRQAKSPQRQAKGHNKPRRQEQDGWTAKAE